MRYTAMIVGFLLATLTTVGAAETDQPDHVAFKVRDLAGTKTFAAIFGWTLANTGPDGTSFDGTELGGGLTTGASRHSPSPASADFFPRS
jgi:hypothetical protein